MQSVELSSRVIPVQRTTGRRLWLWFVRGVLVFMVLNVLGMMALGVYILRYGAKDRARPADVIIVLGGGEIGTWRRARHAAVLYQEGFASHIICSGGTMPGWGYSEADRCARALTKRGVPPQAIILEDRSMSTEENAIDSTAIMRQRDWKTAVVVSDNYHLWRSHWLFEKQGVQVWTSPAQLSDHSLTRRDKLFGTAREIAATGWYVTKTLLGINTTRVG
jgi:uncharacterized SAM-binding protein YcdF (DUF218 family)